MTEITKILDSFLAAGDAMPQAYLFLGSSQPDSDTRQLVEDFAAKITAQTFPNIDTVIYNAGSGDGIEGVREILGLASLMPVSSKRKAVLMLNMDQASPQMLNALLKTLEEPVAHTIFLLLSAQPLLGTVMSRCQVLTLREASPGPQSDELTQALQILDGHRFAGLAERMVLVNELAAMEEELLPQVLQVWLQQQVKELRTAPEKYPAVRVTMETLLSLRGNFNKKMVLQNFVIAGLL